MQDLGREPTPEEIAKVMEVDVVKVREIMKVSQSRQVWKLRRR